MIHYRYGTYGLGVLCKFQGSVLPKVVVVALPPSIIVILIRTFFPELAEEYASNDIGRLYNTFVWVLGIVLVFRTSQAYARYWEGAQQIESVYTNFFDACASIINFSETGKKTEEERTRFQSTVVGLFSLLHCCALQQTTVREDNSFEVVEGVDQDFMDDLISIAGKRQRTEVVGQWIMRLVLEGMNDKTIPTPAPIVARIFQEINAGMLAANRMSTITYTPFPFPYAQMITIGLVCAWFFTSGYMCTLPVHPAYAGAFTFLSVFSLWALNLIAAEIEQPFGDDYNDFDTHETQKEMNRSLLLLLEKQFRSVPPMTPGRPRGTMPLHRSLTGSKTLKSEKSSSDQQSVSCDKSFKALLEPSSHALKSESELDLDLAMTHAKQTAKFVNRPGDSQSNAGGALISEREGGLAESLAKPDDVRIQTNSSLHLSGISTRPPSEPYSSVCMVDPERLTESESQMQVKNSHSSTNELELLVADLATAAEEDKSPQTESRTSSVLGAPRRSERKKTTLV
eukprot:gnl/MRDRNA2_/MRDRNA2_63978_c0_seq1.p1 gnl/MRDRNA2_/MRDRNA2_63978_c0~~gnl/MRDRNA2_/MRDRNA2_63978_c0_seq1.p1  ORF type:complete len:512 (-),score=52.75 gnl/MRDRNA2_/MRDRNA2_63978_c0_seq1:260-1795(-)